MPPTTYKLRLGTEELEAWKNASEKAGLKLAEWMRRELNDVASGKTVYAHVPPIHIEKPREFRTVEGIGDAGSDDQNLRRDPELPLGPGSPVADERTELAPEPAVPQTELQRSVASRTGHYVGCDCFHCQQTMRFLAPHEKPKEEKKPVKKGKRR